MKMTPKQLVSWTLAIGFALLLGFAGVCLSYDVWIADFPRLRAFLNVDSKLIPVLIILIIALLPPTFVVFLLPSSRERVEFSFLGMKLKGPAVPPVLWALIFLASAFFLVVVRRYVL